MRRLVYDAERRAERVIGIIRILMACGLGVILYLTMAGVAPPAHLPVSKQVSLAWVTLAGYAALGVLAIVLSFRPLFRHAFIFLFVTADAVFLAMSLDASLSNSGLTRNYLTALPGVWLLPIILAFGAMRYSPWLQIWGLVALIGGLVIVGVPTTSEWTLPPSTTILTSLFAHPPNIMRSAMILMACIVIALAAGRIRGHLREALEEGLRRRSLTKYLPPKVAALIEERNSHELRTGRRQPVVVMFVDIRGFTRRSEAMAPEAVGRFLSRYRAALDAAATQCGGIIDKFIGDGAMIVFGVPDPQPDDAVRALDCARIISAAVAEWSAACVAAGDPPVAIGIGINAGEAFVGAVGDDARLEFTVVGDTVNVAARAEEETRAQHAEIIATDAVLVAAGERDGATAAGWRALPPTPIRGRSAPVALWMLDSGCERAA
ncbi:adenylate/guanylate cyclase domain-containing protein [Acuticoccus mangrovi]|uniref:Adenylate/guanylate cyclase domain-containing protein n=1 Tax=Acuticoccus mangrovi TaxID=2796142 RepID=A0A934IMJ9_9HYPH|nr:adenylate/guanylate cyclase domain-containing protein [Acuticoccus mangrovi]